MADNYCLFATVELPEQAAMDFMSLCNDDFDDFPQWFVDKHELTEENFDYFENCAGIISYYGDGKLYIASEESGDIDYVAYVLSEIMAYYNLRKPFYIEYAYTCSKPRVGEFGGGVVAIGPNIHKYSSTSCMGSLMVEEMKKEMEANEKSES